MHSWSHLHQMKRFRLTSMERDTATCRKQNFLTGKLCAEYSETQRDQYFFLSFYRCCGGLASLTLTPIFRERGTESNICECKNQVAPPCHKTSLLLLPFHPSQECKQPRSVKKRFRILVHFSCKSSQILPQHRYLDCQDQRAVLPWIQRSNWLCSAE